MLQTTPERFSEILTSRAMTVQIVASIGCVLPDVKAMSLELETIFFRTPWTNEFNSTEALSHSLRIIRTTLSKRKLSWLLQFRIIHQKKKKLLSDNRYLCKLGKEGRVGHVVGKIWNAQLCNDMAAHRWRSPPFTFIANTVTYYTDVEI